MVIVGEGKTFGEEAARPTRDRVDLDRLNADIAAMEAHLRKQFAADHLEAVEVATPETRITFRPWR